MGYLATGEIFGKHATIEGFWFIFERIRIRKWLLSYRNSDISCRHAREFGGILPKKILKRLMQSGAF